MTPDWQELSERFKPAAVAHLRLLYKAPGSFSITAAKLASDTETEPQDAEQLLDALAADGLLVRRSYVYCGQCGNRLDDIPVDDECPECHTAFVDLSPRTVVRYQLSREPPRDVPWVLVLHGMNTRGVWQEELSWLIGRSYRRMVPVAIYKYGLILSGVVFRWRQRMLMRGLIAKIKTLSGQARGAGYGGKPDVIAHSFGTWLIAHALQHEATLRIGRLILLGSIVRPDFDWQTLIDRGQVEAVLNHGATRDEWVPRAHFFIPDSGPGGVRGFSPPVTNVAADGLRHSDYFDPEKRMRKLFAKTWQPFLTWEKVPALRGKFLPQPWEPSLIRFVTWPLAVLAFAAATAVLVTVGFLGFREIIHRLF